MMADSNMDLTTLSDEELVVQSLQDVNVFGLIVDRYQVKLMRYIQRISNVSEEEAEDLLQEVFLKAWENLNGFSTKLKFSSWLYRITHNLVIDSFRKASARGQLEQLELTEELYLPSKEVIEAEFDARLSIEHIAQVLKAMGEGHREMIVLYFLEEKDYAEISDILKSPKGTVASRLSRAKENFKATAANLGIKF